MNKEYLIALMQFSGFDWICDIKYVEGQEMVASKKNESDELWWRPLEAEGSGFTQLFKGSIKRLSQYEAALKD